MIASGPGTGGRIKKMNKVTFEIGEYFPKGMKHNLMGAEIASVLPDKNCPFTMTLFEITMDEKRRMISGRLEIEYSGRVLDSQTMTLLGNKLNDHDPDKKYRGCTVRELKLGLRGKPRPGEIVWIDDAKDESGTVGIHAYADRDGLWFDTADRKPITRGVEPVL